ncbi:hypothetical protein M8C21_006754 [Ambrosia artemisiifolia]|uniref:Uncharacterized protein n=1 Tax=Ambrosia artemisiifolia TaxID=4212 RepID=A0AAD5D5Y9_AMBAR|nr:hypothetical protein M8C21_006754 [Ambrosia artemisiifolia]
MTIPLLMARSEDANDPMVQRFRNVSSYLREKDDVKSDAFSVSHEKLLNNSATKGVVNCNLYFDIDVMLLAECSQKGLNPSKSKDAKVIQRRRKIAFFSELGKTQSGSDAKAVKKMSMPAKEEVDEGFREVATLISDLHGILESLFYGCWSLF